MKNILLVFGGKSFEHDISIITALIIKNRYQNGKYNLVPVYVSASEEWFYFAGKKMTSHMFANFEKTHLKDKFYPAYFKSNHKSIFYKKGLFENKADVFAVLNCCHGGLGEGGTYLSLFDVCKIPSSAGSHTALGICMDKLLSKYCFAGLSVPCLKYFKATKQVWKTNKELIFKNAKNLGYPMIIKPATLGSSIGIAVAKNQTELENGLETAFEFDENLLIEKAILDKMTEFNVACMRKDGKIIVSEIDKPIRSDEILSFKDKYIGNDKNLPAKNGGKNSQKSQPTKAGGYLSENKKFETSLPEKLSVQIKNIAKKAYDELGLFGVCRVDFLMDKKNNVYLNEINAIPGSLAYYFFVPSVFKTMGEFVDCLIDEGLKNFENQNNVKKEYITKLFK